MAKLKELAKVIRSKNSGPYEITFDIMFPDHESYEHVKKSGVLSEELICGLYHVKSEDIIARICSSIPLWLTNSHCAAQIKDCRAVSVKTTPSALSSTRRCWTWNFLTE